ncbi:MAG: branched-chain amino acid ABC transporter permease [Chloroflexi bacterium]|nr:MAG: branched-chain amino acid ABC transporter permease [Chloroflexota bacterium]
MSKAQVIFLAWVFLAGPVWAAIGAWLLPRTYRKKGLEDAPARLVGGLGGFTLGPLMVIPLWCFTPELTRWYWGAGTGVLAAIELYGLFALFQPKNLCVTSPNYVLNQAANGLTIGFIYALIGVGLTLIYSIQGIISFTHGQFYMLGGYISYYFLNTVFHVNPILAIPIAGFITLIIGAIFDILFLRPMHKGGVERVGEYAILVTFGFGFFLEYTTLAIVGPHPHKVPPYLKMHSFKLLTVQLIPNRLVAAAVGVVLILGLIAFLYKTWWGKGLRAVSMNKQAAAITGVNPLTMNTLAFSIGTMLAGMSGAAMVPIFSWVPGVGAVASRRSYIIIVLGGLGSVPGALVGGLILGLVEALGSGCFPDPTRGAAYRDVFGLIIFILILLLKPTGLFGRER